MKILSKTISTVLDQIW